MEGALHLPDADTRGLATEVLGVLGRPPQPTAAGQQDAPAPDDADLLRRAVLTVGGGRAAIQARMGPERAARALAEGLADKSVPARTAYARALAEMGPLAMPALPALARTLRECRAHIAEGRQRYEWGPLSDHVTFALSRIGEAGVGPLVEALDAGGPQEYRDAIARGLGAVQPPSAAGTAALAAHLRQLTGPHASDAGRSMAEALRRQGAVAELVAALDGPAAFSAEWVLGQMGEAAVPALTRAVSSGGPALRLGATRTLAGIEIPAGRPASAALAAVLADDQSPADLVTAADQAFARQGGPEGVPALARAVRGGEPPTSPRAARALGFVCPASDEAVLALAWGAGQADQATRAQSLDSLRRLGPAAAQALQRLATATGGGIGAEDRARAREAIDKLAAGTR